MNVFGIGHRKALQNRAKLQPYLEMAVASVNIRFVVSLSLAFAFLISPQPGIRTTVAQEQAPKTTPVHKPTSVKGTVVSQKKYSFTVDTGSRQIRVKPTTDAKIALLMNKPFFDWKTNKVGVEISSTEQTSQPDDETKKPRLQFEIPTKKPFVLCEFRSVDQLEKWQASKDKRLNFYVVMHQEPEMHDPTKEEPFLAAKIVPVKNNLVKLETENKSYRVRLGFHTATMSGFSVADLKPKKTRVTLSGVLDEETGIINANNIIFEPIEK